MKTIIFSLIAISAVLFSSAAHANIIDRFGNEVGEPITYYAPEIQGYRTELPVNIALGSTYVDLTSFFRLAPQMLMLKAVGVRVDAGSAHFSIVDNFMSIASVYSSGQNFAHIKYPVVNGFWNLMSTRLYLNVQGKVHISALHLETVGPVIINCSPENQL